MTRPVKSDCMGGVAAALVAAGAGAAACGVYYVLAGIKAVGPFFNFYKPSGVLSGVSSAAIVTWLLTWAVLARRWKHRTVPLGRVSAIALVLLAVGLMLTFPPIARLF